MTVFESAASEKAAVAGRGFPLHYRYPAAALAGPAALTTDTLYVVGGLYGNPLALDALLRLAARETQTPAIVFNGDFNWFDIDPAGFLQINQAVLRHTALRGNVETELAGDDSEAGCGCAYPDHVGDAEVEYSNRILKQLRTTARAFPGLRQRLAGLSMHLTADVGGVRIGIVHGDAESLAGWGFAHDALAEPGNTAKFARWFAAAQVRVFACSHTCLPALREFALAGGKGLVINNGAAGMPNFSGTRFGVITRVGLGPAPAGSVLYGSRIDGVHVDALRLEYGHDAWVRQFLANWPEGSPAHSSYFRRIMSGPTFSPEQAFGTAISHTIEQERRIG